MYTEGLCNFIYKTNYEDIPAEVIKAAKDAIRDNLAVTMSGSQEPSGRMMSELVKEYQSAPEATVIGHRYKASAALAALSNGTSAHTQDYDDCLDYPSAGLAHPTAGTFSGLLTFGEKNHISGKDLITAYCLGIEAYGKTGQYIVTGGAGRRGWEWTGTLGIIGGTIGLAKLLGFDQVQMKNALGVASTMACSLIRNFGSYAGHIHGGHAARCAIDAVMLVQKGYDATGDDVIEGRGGYFNAFSDFQDSLSEEKQKELLDMLGNPWNLLTPGLMFKYYPCAHIAHFGGYAGQEMRKKYSFDWKDISEILFETPFVRSGEAPPPENDVQGRFSLGYCLCRALIHGTLEFGFFTNEAVKDPDVRDLMKKITWKEISSEGTQLVFGFQEITLKMKDGTVFNMQVDHPKGEPQNPQTPEELSEKFHKCARYANYDDSAISRMEELVMDFENIKDINELTDILCK
ncbi:MAG: MmgE/PrpD family protein [Dehalococcoidales bacterium]|nr:MmgE/PrpD family protein [Dehalococcoidales bacterium]